MKKTGWKYWLIGLALLTGLSQGTIMAKEKEKPVFDFSREQQVKPWRAINDTVMGGVSTSSVGPSGQGTLRFSGTVSLENYGGFCSTSMRANKPFDLSGCQGLRLRVLGDGKKYKVTLKNDVSFSGFVYQYAFTPRKGEWMTVSAPFAGFVPTFRGRARQDAAPIDPKNIRSFGFIISDKQPGPFRLEVKWIKAF